ncbi:SRPBCC family protein [Pseudooceanicola algae]|uniref:Uncharacterized protein n=1 Tax=Pseudooceanicola algae TaxID=1537215 RepID=A0A418SIF6_9RHOB|nr:SRPBCC family protein [Pseudooceanicola algae]QPM91126.1 hypothetical protein PSAL_023750 [Pseudooceanicola algae]
MKVVAKEDIEAPIQKVFAGLTDFRTFERSAIRRGAGVKRVGDFEVAGEGVAWDANFTMRGKRRDIRLQIEQYDAPEHIRLTVRSDGMHGLVKVDLVALSPSRTRLRVETEIKPQTLSARLLLQSLRLARSNVQTRLQKRLSDFAATIEGRPGIRRA